MSRLFESFEFLDRRWDARVLEGMSLRSVFLCLLLYVVILCMDTAVTAYDYFHLHRVSWPIVFNIAVFGPIAYRFARIIYRSLGSPEKSSSSQTTT
jgi:hypothetical protein